MAKKTIQVTLYMSELIYDAQNKTYLTGRARFTGENHENVANMQANDDEENANQIMRSVGNAFATLKTKLSEYLDEYGTSTTDELMSVDASLSIVLNMPSNYNNTANDTISAAMHQYIVNLAIADWFTITNKPDAESYMTLAAADLQQLREALNKRRRPKRMSLKPIVVGEECVKCTVSPSGIIAGIGSDVEVVGAFEYAEDDVQVVRISLLRDGVEIACQNGGEKRIVSTANVARDTTFTCHVLLSNEQELSADAKVTADMPTVGDGNVKCSVQPGSVIKGESKDIIVSGSFEYANPSVEVESIRLLRDGEAISNAVIGEDGRSIQATVSVSSRTTFTCEVDVMLPNGSTKTCSKNATVSEKKVLYVVKGETLSPDYDYQKAGNYIEKYNVDSKSVDTFTTLSEKDYLWFILPVGSKLKAAYQSDVPFTLDEATVTMSTKATAYRTPSRLRADIEQNIKIELQ